VDLTLRAGVGSLLLARWAESLRPSELWARLRVWLGQRGNASLIKNQALTTHAGHTLSAALASAFDEACV
jgi:hypothetical protein